MMVTLEEANSDYLAQQVRRTGNTRSLIQHLRRHGTVTPALAELLADMLEGRVKARPRRAAVYDLASTARTRLAHYKRVLEGEHPDAWDEIEPELIATGLFEPAHPDMTKGERTHIAKLLTARSIGLTMSQLDEALSPRAVRSKNR